MHVCIMPISPPRDNDRPAPISPVTRFWDTEDEATITRREMSGVLHPWLGSSRCRAVGQALSPEKLIAQIARDLVGNARK